MSNGTRINFTDTSKSLPRYLVLDSSVLLHAVLPPPNPPERLFSDTQRFLSRLEIAIAQNTTRAYAPLHAITECYHAITKNALRPFLTATDQKDVTKIHKRNPDILTVANVPERIEKFLDSLFDLGIAIVQLYEFDEYAPATFEERVLFYMRNLRLLSIDASIVTTADLLGVSNIASVDKDFLRITQEGFNIYTSKFLR